MVSSPSDSTDQGRLRLLCRRGTRELDVLLERWMKRCYADAAPHTRTLFLKLLALEDDVLQDILVRGKAPAQEFVDLVDAIRQPLTPRAGG